MRKKNKKVSLGKKPFLVLSRRAIAGWLVAVFFVSAWMFGIGVLVGRGTSPLKIDINELQKKLQIARNELKKKEQMQSPEKSDPGKDKPELDTLPGLQSVIKSAEKELGAEGKVLVRYSGTEPKLRIMVQGTEQKKIEGMLESLLQSAAKDLNVDAPKKGD